MPKLSDCSYDSYDILTEDEKDAVLFDLFPNYSEQEIEDALEGA